MGDIKDLHFHSNYRIDRILRTLEGQATVGGSTSSTESISTGISESTFFQGIYSPDGGTTWKDLNTRSHSNSLQLHGRSNSNTFSLVLNNTSGTSRTVDYKIALFERLGQGDVTVGEIGSDIVFDTRLNYQKIHIDESQDITVLDTAEDIFEFTHSLGYIPKVRTFIETSGTYQGKLAGLYEATYFIPTVMSAGASAPDSGLETESGVYIDSTKVYVILNNQSGSGDFSGKLYARVYHDD